MSVSKVKTFRNIIHASFTKGITLLCTAITTMVVARSLNASDYGLVGFATIIIGFLMQFNDMGLQRAAIRRPVLEGNSLQTAFTLKATLSVIAFVIALLIAPFGRQFLDHPSTGNVIRILALNFLVSTIGFAPRVVLSREMNYRALMLPAVVGAMFECIVAVVLIRSGWSYWAVVIADVAGTAATGLSIHFVRPTSTHMQIDWADAREYLRFGLPLLGGGILIFILLNVDNFLVSTSMGSAQLGYYALAFTWSTFICMLLNETVNVVLLPALSSKQADVAAMRRWYLKTIELTGFIGVIANTALLANAYWFLVTFLGKGSGKWLPAQTALEILCVYGVVRAITVPIGICITVRGQTDLLLRANILAGAVEIALLVLALRAGRIDLVAVAVLVAYLTQAAVFVPYLRREFSIGLRELISKVWPVAPAMAIGALVTSLLPAQYGSTFVALAMRGLFTASVVALTHGLFSGFRCFHETRELIAPHYRRVGNSTRLPSVAS
jgi:O-antigen/teichoic acid export membrane protein